MSTVVGQMFFFLALGNKIARYLVFLCTFFNASLISCFIMLHYVVSKWDLYPDSMETVWVIKCSCIYCSLLQYDGTNDIVVLVM